jgi:hypothetical protein
MSKFLLLILILFSSCATFVSKNLNDKEIPELLKALKGQGEGKGRISLNGSQYRFSFEAFLKEKEHWILAVSIPFHGEEVLEFRNLSALKEERIGGHSFERRIEQGIKNYLINHGESAQLAREFMLELRSLIRLMLYQDLGLVLNYDSQSRIVMDHIYQVEKKKYFLSIKKDVGSHHELELRAANLTESFFKRTEILLHSKKSARKEDPILSLELFWN